MAEFEFVPLVVVESVPWSVVVLGMVLVVVVDDPPVPVVLLDWAKANPVDSATMADAKSSCFMINSMFECPWAPNFALKRRFQRMGSENRPAHDAKSP
ncbi:hypothetical protein, partial [Mesorhizobium sp.]|uniref:hypothetical protein n=1 Tax=Mesorhizobium sp. TaxID=1871066 RepID=UPI0025F840B2